MPSRPKLSLQVADAYYERLISDDDRDSDGNTVVQAVSEGKFSLLKYFCFFVVGLSMMWTWYC